MHHRNGLAPWPSYCAAVALSFGWRLLICKVRRFADLRLTSKLRQEAHRMTRYLKIRALIRRLDQDFLKICQGPKVFTGLPAMFGLLGDNGEHAFQG